MRTAAESCAATNGASAIVAWTGRDKSDQLCAKISRIPPPTRSAAITLSPIRNQEVSPLANG